MSIFHNIWVKKILFDVSYALTIFLFRNDFIPNLDGDIVENTFRVIISFFLWMLCICLIGMIIEQIRSAIKKESEIGYDQKGIYLYGLLIAWDQIKEFKIKRTHLFHKTIYVIGKPDGEVLKKRGIIARLFHKSHKIENNRIWEISPEKFNGSAESFVAYLEGEKKRYGKE